MTEPRKSLLHVTGLLFVSRGFGWALGFVRELSIAALFGASRMVDAFTAAVFFPLTLFGTAASVLSTTLIPHFIGLKADFGEEEARRSLRAIQTQLLLITATLTALTILFAPQLIRWIAPMFTPEESALAQRFLRIAMPGVIGGVLFLILQNVYQLYDKWTAPAISPLLANVAGLLALFLGAWWFGAEAMAWSWLATMLVVPLALLFGKIGRSTLRPMLFDRHLAGFYRMALPMLLAALLGQSVQFINRYLASGLPVGELSALAYAQRTYMMCVELVVATIIPALFPRLSESAVSCSRDEYRRLLNKAILGVSFITLLGATVLAGVTLPVVRLAFERGAFVATDSIRVASILTILCGSLTVFIPLLVLYRAFYAERNTLVPTVVLAGTIAIDVALNFLLIKPLGTPGLAIASFTGLALQLIILTYIAPRFRVELPQRRMLFFFLKGIPFAIAVAALTRIVVTTIEPVAILLPLAKLWLVLVPSLIAGVVFYFGAKLIRLEGFTIADGFLRNALSSIRNRIAMLFS
ncbi:MAG: hypothetical protein OEM52_07685 [bacterium]|nr:hypothetical protein [bacterium]